VIGWQYGYVTCQLEKVATFEESEKKTYRICKRGRPWNTSSWISDIRLKPRFLKKLDFVSARLERGGPC
jgi:hypothetical protein